MSPDQRALDTVRQDAICDALRDDLADARRDARMYQMLYRAALDGLSLVATAPERYEQMQRELRKEREQFMAETFAERVA